MSHHLPAVRALIDLLTGQEPHQAPAPAVFLLPYFCAALSGLLQEFHSFRGY